MTVQVVRFTAVTKDDVNSQVYVCCHSLTSHIRTPRMQTQGGRFLRGHATGGRNFELHEPVVVSMYKASISAKLTMYRME